MNMKKTVTLTDDQLLEVMTALEYAAAYADMSRKVSGIGAKAQEMYTKSFQTLEETIQTIKATPWEY